MNVLLHTALALFLTGVCGHVSPGWVCQLSDHAGVVDLARGLAGSSVTDLDLRDASIAAEVTLFTFKRNAHIFCCKYVWSSAEGDQFDDEYVCYQKHEWGPGGRERRRLERRLRHHPRGCAHWRWMRTRYPQPVRPRLPLGRLRCESSRLPAPPPVTKASPVASKSCYSSTSNAFDQTKSEMLSFHME